MTASRGVASRSNAAATLLAQSVARLNCVGQRGHQLPARVSCEGPAWTVTIKATIGATQGWALAAELFDLHAERHTRQKRVQSCYFEVQGPKTGSYDDSYYASENVEQLKTYTDEMARCRWQYVGFTSCP